MKRIPFLERASNSILMFFSFIKSNSCCHFLCLNHSYDLSSSKRFKSSVLSLIVTSLGILNLSTSPTVKPMYFVSGVASFSSEYRSEMDHVDLGKCTFPRVRIHECVHGQFMFAACWTNRRSPRAACPRPVIMIQVFSPELIFIEASPHSVLFDEST